MTLREVAGALGIGKYPEELERVYCNLYRDNVDICNTSYIEELKTEYSFLEEYSELVKAAAKQLRTDEIRRSWGLTVATYLRDYACPTMGKIPLPESDGSLKGDMLPLLILLPLLPKTVERYRKAGIDEVAIQGIFKSFGRCIKSTEKQTGRPGLNAMYYNWLMLYIKVALLPYGSFNFELRTLPMGAEGLWGLKHRTTGEEVLLANGGTYHRSGMVLGSAGFVDARGAFIACFEETEEAYMGYPAVDHYISNMRHTYLKNQWECVLEPGDLVVGVHIPKGTNLSPLEVERSYKEGIELIRNIFPQYTPKCLFCLSWLMDPTLENMLGSESKITKFQRGFIRCPHLSEGKDIFNFVFSGFRGELKELPENTGLERALKAHYLAGKYVYAFKGVRFL